MPARAMPLHQPEIVLLVTLTVLWPLYEFLHGWPRFCRQVSAGEPDARVSMYRESMLVQWGFVGAFVAAWSAAGRPWDAPALSIPAGARLWGSVLLVAILVALQARQLRALSRSRAVREALARKLSSMPFLIILPTCRRELAWIFPLCLTAGFCEELLYRGFMVWGLSVSFGWWGATALSLLSFGLVHSYQGWSGILRTAATGLVMSVVVAITRSLWPAMMLHALVDVGSVSLLYMMLRDGSSDVSTGTPSRASCCTPPNQSSQKRGQANVTTT